MQVEARIEKAFRCYSGTELVFGTLYTVPTPTQGPKEVVEVGLITDTDREKIKLPDNWRHYAPIWVSNDGLTEFCAFYFEVKHGLKFKHPRGGRMPKEILWLLSGWLQRGEFSSYRNYQRYCQLEGLKFLPLLVTHTHYRFFVFRPTVERVEAAVETFKRAVEVLSGLDSCNLPWLAVRLLTSLRDDELWPVRYERQDPKTLRYKRHLSFVYRDLKGPQDAVRFILG